MTDARSEDAALMRRVATGDPAACRRGADRHLRRVVGFAAGMLDDPAAAEDIAQECFIRLWRRAGKWKPDARIGTWLYTIARNMCIDVLRKRNKFDPNFDGNAISEQISQTPPYDAPDRRLQQDDIARAVNAQIANLPERQRAAIILVHQQEVGNMEAAEILDVSVEALESLLARGRRALRAALLDRKDSLIGDAT